MRFGCLQDIRGYCARMEWSGTDVAFLRRHAELGARAIAEELGRSVPSVERQAHRLRISLRQPGSRRGSVLCQPRGVSIASEIRDDVTSGRVPADALAERIALVPHSDLCPCCAVRAIQVPSSGFCLPCHLRRLADAHREALADLAAEEDARRELWATRQELKRARDEAGAA